jgi:hypothetical protein
MPATVYVCQGGCGKFEEDLAQMTPRGIISEKLYCGACIEEIDEYLSERDDLHTKLAADWGLELQVLKDSYAKDGRHLPDD